MKFVTDERYVVRSPYDYAVTASDEDKTVILLDSILFQAIELKASDVHLQPTELSGIVRMRVDGQLFDHQFIDHDEMAALIIRLKALSRLDVAQSRVPQDGHLRIHSSSQDHLIALDLRIATFPTMYGEKVVIRLLDHRIKFRSFQALGIIDSEKILIEKMLKLSHGLVITTGPTGSGKTTLLYAMLNQLNNRQRNIMTLEDPVEYVLEGISQTSINPLAGLTFASGLRALLRQDPDIIMLGEIRDAETSRIALQSALTGHLVLSTLHTNDAVSAVARLHDLGVPLFIIAQCLKGAIAQRLVRVLCSDCKKQTVLSESDALLIHNKLLPGSTLYAPVGCIKCRNTGYRGRIGIFEFFIPTQKDLDAIGAGATLKLAPQISLLDSFCIKLAAGDVNFDQVYDVLF